MKPLIIYCVCVLLAFVILTIFHEIKRKCERHKALKRFKESHDENQLLECANTICKKYHDYTCDDIFLICSIFEKCINDCEYYLEIVDLYDEFYQYMQPNKSPDELKKYIDGNLAAAHNFYVNLRKDGLMK